MTEAATIPAQQAESSAKAAEALSNAPASGATATPDASDPNNKDADHPQRKKRRLSVDRSLIISDERSKRRRSPSPEAAKDKSKDSSDPDPKDPARAKALGMQIYNKILHAKDASGESLSDPFITLPNKKQFPDYYEMIKLPMSLEMVKARLDESSYDTLKAVVTDLGQIFNNAKRYNIKESTIFQHAKKLHKMTRTFYIDATTPGKAVEDSDDEDAKPAVASHAMKAEVSQDGADDAAGSSQAGDEPKSGKKRGGYMREGPTVYRLVKPVLKAIKEATSDDGTGREIAGIFMQLPDRRDLPDYYRTIKQPIALSEIENRMLARVYQTWEEFFDECELMVSNALTYNEDGSEVYRDAQQIKGILDSHRAQIIDRLSKPAVPKNKVKEYNTPSAVQSPQQPLQQPVYNQRPGYPTASPSPAGFAPQPSPQPTLSQSPITGYLPPLPKGVVTEEIVNSLDRYSTYDQNAWASSLPPLAVQVYRQIVAQRDSKKRNAGSPLSPYTLPQGVVPSVLPQPQSPHSVLADPPSSGRPNGITNLPDRLVPQPNSITHVDFAFASGGKTDRSSAIRLHNMRGVVTHAVVLSSETSELELTAYFADKANPAEIPVIGLRINGNQGSPPTPVPLTDDSKLRAARWTVGVPTGHAELKIELVASRPGMIPETTWIYVSRQF